MATAHLKAIQQELRSKAKPENVEFFSKMVPGKQKIYGVKRASPEIKKLVKALENDKEYYVKKAVVWIKRNFDKGK